MSAQIVQLKPRKPVRRSMPKRRPNAQLRTREYLTPSEVAKLMTVAGKRSRYGQRDASLILLAYRHGLRVSELVALKWDQVDLKGSSSTSAAPKTARPRPIRCRAMSFGLCGSSPASGPSMADSSSCRSGVAR